jgi:hypothetical protein
MDLNPFILGLNFKASQIFSSVLPLLTKAVLNERLVLKLRLASTRTDLGKVTYTKVVDNFDVFPVSIYTPIYDKRSMSNDHWKSGDAAGNSSFLDRSAKLNQFGVWAFAPMETEEAPNTTHIGDFSTFPRRGAVPYFSTGRRNSRPWKLGKENGWS